MNFAPLHKAAKSLAAGAQRYQKALAAAQLKTDRPVEAARLESLNGILIQAERALTDPAGLPGRSWYKHLLYAPGVYAGYGAKTLPGVREGLELGRYAEAEREIVRVAKVLQAETALLDSATRILRRIE